jgi:hypothetical protein
MVISTAGIKRVVGPNGSSPVSFHDAWPLSQSEVIFKSDFAFSPTESDAAFRDLAQPIRYASSF